MKITGMKEALKLYREAEHTIMYVNIETGEVWTNEYADERSYTQYQNDKIYGVKQLTIIEGSYPHMQAKLSKILDKINSGKMTVEEAIEQKYKENNILW